ncbi:MAG: NUDIX hydrolase N-terminal domain-containing protein [Acidimicrobiales bacterium]
MSQTPSQRDLLRWAEALAGTARTGLGFTESLYEKERYEEILHVAAEIRHRADQLSGHDFDVETLVNEWLGTVGQGVPGYVTPKVTVAAVVGNEAGELLLVQRAGSEVWLYPTGWADVGYSPAEVVVKEVQEETGIECEVVRPIAILDGMRLGFTGIPLYSLVFHCRMTGGELQAHPLECADVGFFAEGHLPAKTALPEQWAQEAFAAIREEDLEVRFDAPRDPLWEGQENVLSFLEDPEEKESP